MLTMQPSDVHTRSHRASPSNPWSPIMRDFSDGPAPEHTYARHSPTDVKARPAPDVFQNGAAARQALESASRSLPPVAGTRSNIDHDDLLAPQRAGNLSDASSPPSDHSDLAAQHFEGQSAASTSPRSAQSSEMPSVSGSSPPTSASAPDTSATPYPKSLLPESLESDLSADATPIPLRWSEDEPAYFPSTSEGLRRHHNGTSMASPLSPHVEPFSPTIGSGQMPALSVAPSASDLHAKHSSASLASLASAASLSDLRAANFDSRASSSAGSVSSGVTVHSLYAHSYNEPNGLLPADLVSPNSLASAAFASLGAQLAMNDRVAGHAARSVHDGSTNGSEEISTIFVVGFPDDMQEREFQNMFIFSPGFEAATLKTPHASASNASSGSRESAGKFGLPPSAGLDGYAMPYGQFDMDDGYARERAMASMQDQKEALLQQQRKQIIGFAKFRTRQEAVDAVSVLSGRRVDADKDCVLKAEMAKKNLHTKRGLANETAAGSSSAVGVGNAAGNNSLPPSVLALGQHNLAVAAALSPQVIANALAQQQVQRDPATVAALMRDQEAQREVRAQQLQSAAFDAFHSVPPPQPSPAYPGLDRHSREGSAVAQADPRYTAYGSRERHESISSPTSTAPYFRSNSLSGQTAYGKSLLQQLDTDTPYSSAGPSSAIGQTSDGYTRHAFYSSSGLDDHTSQSYGGLGSVHAASGLGSRISGLSLNTGLSSTRPTSPIASGLTSPRGTNPADMNPPINTLYVGGLPAVLPSLTGPMSASHLEDSLRAVFSRSPGFKRLCFRQKSKSVFACRCYLKLTIE
jgi:hypothetical protein